MYGGSLIAGAMGSEQAHEVGADPEVSRHVRRFFDSCGPHVGGDCDAALDPAGGKEGCLHDGLRLVVRLLAKVHAHLGRVRYSSGKGTSPLRRQDGWILE